MHQEFSNLSNLFLNLKINWNSISSLETIYLLSSLNINLNNITFLLFHYKAIFLIFKILIWFVDLNNLFRDFLELTFIQLLFLSLQTNTNLFGWALIFLFWLQGYIFIFAGWSFCVFFWFWVWGMIIIQKQSYSIYFFLKRCNTCIN